MNPPAPLCIGMNWRGMPVTAKAACSSPMVASCITSTACSSVSGWRYMSSVLPRRLRNVSETTSNAGMSAAPQVGG